MTTKAKASVQQHLVRVRRVRPGSRWSRGVCTEPSCSFVTGELATIACVALSRKHGVVDVIG